MSISTRLFRFSLIVFAALALTTTPAFAGLNTFSDSNVGGFVADSAFDTPAFLTEIGTPDVFLTFDNPGPLVQADGASFSPEVVFSSAVSTTFGGSNTSNVTHGATDVIGPSASFNGILVIDFLAAGNTASIVGFGPVELGPNEAIRVFDQNNALIDTFFGVSDNDFTFFGVQGTSGMEIGRIELDGGFFSIQDIQFDIASSAIPAPAALPAGIALLGMLGLKRKRKNAA